MSKVKKLFKASDLTPRAFDVDKKLTLEELENKEVVIEAFEERSGSFGDFVIALAHYPDGEEFFTFSTGAKVIMELLRHARNKEMLPLVGKIVRLPGKNNPSRKYWTLQ